MTQQQQRGSRALLRLLRAVHEDEMSPGAPFPRIAPYHHLLTTKDERFWQREGEKKALRLFFRAAKEIPAYKDFLRKHRVRPASIETIADFEQLPVTTKENYISRYSLADRSWHGKIQSHKILAMSSGTSGKPSLWSRGKLQEYEAVLLHEMLFNTLCKAEKYKTLVLIGFPMGVYVSGIATALPTFFSALEHPNITIATVGNKKDDMLSLIKHAQEDFQQIVLIGHPFFIKDVVETGKRKKIVWSRTKLRAIFCSEGFNEAWRRHLAARIRGITPATSMFNTYGSSEFLLVGFENPFTIFLRQRIEKNKKLRTLLFQTEHTPGIFQYNPLMRYIEDGGGTLLITAASGVPLIRFNQHDAGTILSCRSIGKALADTGISKDLAEISWKHWNVPIVVLHGRSDRSIVFYAANIYPEHIQHALNNRAFLGKLTGKFVLKKKYLKNMDQYLEIHVELQQKAQKNKVLEKALRNKIVDALEKLNMEYLFLRQNLDKDIVPRIVLHPYQSPQYFRPDLKPRYIV